MGPVLDDGCALSLNSDLEQADLLSHSELIVFGAPAKIPTCDGRLSARPPPPAQIRAKLRVGTAGQQRILSRVKYTTHWSYAQWRPLPQTSGIGRSPGLRLKAFGKPRPRGTGPRAPSGGRRAGTAPYYRMMASGSALPSGTHGFAD
jgi:hypothetical protein